MKKGRKEDGKFYKRILSWLFFHPPSRMFLGPLFVGWMEMDVERQIKRLGAIRTSMKMGWKTDELDKKKAPPKKRPPRSLNKRAAASIGEQQQASEQIFRVQNRASKDDNDSPRANGLK